MARNIQLLLLQSIENLGIVGDIVKVKPGHARNYLLPMGLAEPPTPAKIEALREERAAAQAELHRLRQMREELLGRMEEVEIELVRSSNDQGALYGSVSQRDIADALQEAGYDVGVRSVRLPSSLRRVGDYTVPIQFDKDLRTEVLVRIKPDHELEELIEETEAAEATEEQKPREREFHVPKEAMIEGV